MKPKSFKQIRNKNNFVLNKKVDGVSVAIEKDNNKFVAVVDGDRLDTFNTKAEAEKAAVQFVKQFKAMK